MLKLIAVTCATASPHVCSLASCLQLDKIKALSFSLLMKIFKHKLKSVMQAPNITLLGLRPRVGVKLLGLWPRVEAQFL